MHAQLDPRRYPGLCRLRPAASQRGSPKRAREQAGEVPASDRAVRMVGHFDTLLTAPPPRGGWRRANHTQPTRRRHDLNLPNWAQGDDQELTWGPDSGSAPHSIFLEETKDGHV